MPSKLELLSKKREHEKRIAHMVVEQPIVEEPKKKGGKKPVRKFLVVDEEVDQPKEPIEEKEEVKEELPAEDIPFETEE